MPSLTRPTARAPIGTAVALALSLVALGGCATSAGPLGESGTLHTGQVVQVLTRGDIMAGSDIHASLNRSGVGDAAIADGSVVVVRTLCCGPTNTANPHGALNPQRLPLRTGDVVEFLWPGGSAVNTVTRVVQSADQQDGECWWDPKDDKLWRRVMYCQWMPREGWVQQTSPIPGWYKPAGPP